MVMKGTIEAGYKFDKGWTILGIDSALEPNYRLRKSIAFYGSWWKFRFAWRRGRGGVLSRQIYSNYTAILPYTYRRESLRVEDGRRGEERSEVMYCIVVDTYLYIIDVRTDHAVLCVVLFDTHRSIY